MAQAIRGVNKKLKKFLLSNYSLVTQIIIINLFTAIIGFIFLFIFNYLLLFGNNNIEEQKKNIKEDLYKISEYLSNNAVIRIPQFNDAACENQTKEIGTGCGEIILSNPQLDPTSTQKYILDNFINTKNIIKVYDDSWIKFADTEDIYESSDVIEIDIEEPEKTPNIYIQYREFYLQFYNNLQKNFNKNKIYFQNIKYKGEILLVKETISRKNELSYIYEDENKNIKSIYSIPIIKDSMIHGVVLVSGLLNKEFSEEGLISFNLLNLFIIIIIIMFIFSILFSQSIVSPIKILSRIVRFERDKSKKNKVLLTYPERNDEIGILSNEIKSMFEDLKKRIDEIESFAADVSHELKNPLASFRSSIELLLNEKIETHKKTELIKNMKNDIDRMNTLINDISSYTLTQVEIDDELFSSFDLIIFLKDFLSSYEINYKNIKINVEFEDAQAFIYANKHKLAQVFINLIENSLSFSPKNSEMLVQQETNRGNIKVLIFDQGIGIPENSKEKIFERFYTDRPLKQNEHSGLGLSISKNIIESFSGSINIVNNKSKKYLGACFEINLPLKD